MGKENLSPAEQIKNNGFYKNNYGNYNSHEEAIEALSKMLQDGGTIKNLLIDIDRECGLKGADVKAVPVNIGDTGKYSVFVSIEKPLNFGGKGSK